MAKTNAQRQAEYKERQKALKPYIDLGRKYGEDEADRRGETGQKREDRIKRAIGYQIWLYEEGRPPA